ncbi:enoyl-CoA hydratase-related protein [Celerinatantimonas yamalensis]|uniref:Enoyl-CoA hydratase-related protein n=1 Tax=Celerinatantimonas yamalensis TaxID=559956 RepID=A0ABW9GAV1_9GAMM
MIQSQLNEGILTVTLDRPDQSNSFTCEMFRTMRERMKDAALNSQIRVIILQAQGDHFSLGQDIEDLSHSQLDARHPALTFMREFALFPKPIIANVQGNAFGFGMALLLHCDLVVADPNSRFQLPFIRQELMPLFATSMLLPQRVGPQRSAALLLLAQQFSAEQACQWGLINEVANAETRQQLVTSWSQQLSQMPELLVRQTKQLLLNGQPTNDKVMCNEWHLFSESLHLPESQTS